MARINKLEKLINKMTDDMEKNIILVSKKMNLINSMNDDNKCVLNEIMYPHRDEIKVMNFIKAYFYNLTMEHDVNFNKILGIENVKNQVCGNGTFLHRAVSSNYSIFFIKYLLEVIDGYTNTENTNHSKYVYELINIRDRYCEHFLHYYFSQRKDDISNDYDDLCYLISEYNMEFGFKPYNIFEILNKYNNNDEKILSDKQLIDLKQLIFKNSLDVLPFKDEILKKEHIEELFGRLDICYASGSLLHWCFIHQKGKYPFNEKDATKHIFDRVKNLLEIGVDPNLMNYDGESFIEYAIKAFKDPNYLWNFDYNNTWQYGYNYYPLKEMLEISIKYGFDIKKHPKLFETYLNSLYNIGDAFEIYKILCENGYKSYGFDNIDENYIRLRAPFLNFNYEYVNFLNLFTFNSNCERLIYNLRINGLIVEEDFVKKYRDICCHYGEEGLLYTGEPLIIELNDLLNDIQKFINIDSIDYFMVFWVEAIINQRKDSINLDEGPITVLETITALNYMVTNYQTENIVNEDKNKILTHIANITN